MRHAPLLRFVALGAALGAALALTPWACGGTAIIDGEGGPDCEGMQRRYGELLAEAKACGPVDEDPCVEPVAGGLTPCDGCITFANIDNGEEIAALNELVNDYNAAGCADRTIDCGGMLCTDAVGARCGPNRQCEDMR